ncbi:MAG TPA: Na+/H+ antiporter NhaA, partial [Longimicrobiaceae bacterium]|nr:Na+/H+ antiporter NhaA [Longimicrobiaceae bacterium]
VRLGMAEMPAGMRWGQVHGAAWLAGIGFTMSLFVGGLAFSDPEMVDRAKIGIFTASIAAGLMGWLLVRRSTTPIGIVPVPPAMPAPATPAPATPGAQHGALR